MRSPEIVSRPLQAVGIIAFALAASMILGSPGMANQLYVGGASISITPDEPIALSGQRAVRIANRVESLCIATALALETRDEDRSLEQTIFVTCDLVAIRGGEKFYDEVREQLEGRIPATAIEKIIINATHTHTGPVTESGRYDIPAEGVMAPEAYRAWLMTQLADVIVAAWEKRAPARVAWGLGHAVIAQNRRATYANGSAKMYGATDSLDFRGLEGQEDHGVEILYFWNLQDQLIATVINVACPAQEVESGRSVNADFWHPVREQLKAEYGDDLQVLAWTGASGDQSPHWMVRKEAEQRMRQLRGTDGVGELARRIVSTWQDVYQVVRHDKQADVLLAHQSKKIQLPLRAVTSEEYDKAKAALAMASSNAATAKFNDRWHGSVVRRYEQQQLQPQFYEMTLRCVRIGDIAVATNDFELFTDYGIQIKARSPALQTFVIQLSGAGTYVPTQRAVDGGGYGAVIESSIVGPTGAQTLVDETVETLKTMWKE